MKLRRMCLSVVVCLAITELVYSGRVAAVSLRIAPLSYEATLQKNEVKKGYIDISNPEPTEQHITLGVQAFRQIDDNGSLEFFESKPLREGIKIDLDTITLPPHGAYRVYFLIDGSKLPTGDVYGALFASTQQGGKSGSIPAVRVGTLLLIQNGTPAGNMAEVSSIDAPMLQAGDSIRARLSVHNTSNAKTTGFMPSIEVAPSPYAGVTVKGPLVFADRTRTVMYNQEGSYLGPILLKARVGTSEKSVWIIAVTGYWRIFAPLIGLLMIISGLWLWVRRRH